MAATPSPADVRGRAIELITGVFTEAGVPAADATAAAEDAVAGAEKMRAAGSFAEPAEPDTATGVGAAGLEHEKVGHTDQGLWHHKGLQLPAYIEHIANDLIDERGMTESEAIATAISRCKLWCAGGGGVTAETRAKACEAIAQWEALKTGADLTPAHAAGPAPAQLPALVTIPGVDLLATGTWELSTGRQTFTRDDLTHAIQGAQCPAVGDPVIKIGHLDDRFTPNAGGDAASPPASKTRDGEPAIGRVTNMRLTTGGNKITGDLAGMPGWLGAITPSAFPRRSVEGRYNFTCQIGHTHPFVVTAVALLGVTPPGVGVLSGLDDIARLYGLTASASGGQPWRTQPTGDQENPMPATSPVTEEDVRRAFYNAGTPQTRWITELQMAPAQLIVADEADGKLYRVPFQLDGTTVTFQQPHEIAVTYSDVAAARGTGPVIVFASAAESRAVIEAGTLPPGLAAYEKKKKAQTSSDGGGGSSGDSGGGGSGDSGGGSSGGYQIKVGVKGCFGHAVVDSAGKLVPGGCHPDEASAQQFLNTLTKGGKSTAAAALGTWDGNAAVRNLGDNPTSTQIHALFALPGDTKTDSKLPHHNVSSTGEVGAPNGRACVAAIAAINGAHGGLAGTSPAAKKTAYNHLAAHLRDLNLNVPDFAGSAEQFDAAFAGLLAAAETALASHESAPDDGETVAELDLDGNIIFDADGDALAAASHGACDTTHSHAHPAMGSQGGDATHTHEHSHSGDASHDHQHDTSAAAAANTEGNPANMEFTTEQQAAMRSRLGLKDGEPLTPERIAAAFGAPAAPVAAASPDGNTELPPISDGTYLVDASILKDYQARAAAGDAAAHRLRISERDTILAAAIQEGKFPRARLEHYQKMWDGDPEGARNHVAALAAGLVPMVPTGRPGTDADMPGDFEDQAAYRALYPDEFPAARTGGR